MKITYINKPVYKIEDIAEDDKVIIQNALIMASWPEHGFTHQVDRDRAAALSELLTEYR